MDIFRWPLGAQFESEKQTEPTEISWKGALDPVEQLAATFFSSTLPNPHGDGQARQSNKTSWEKKKKGHHQLIRRRIRGHNRINPVQQLQTSKVVSSFRRFFLFLPLGVTSHTFWDRNEIYSEKKGNQPQSHAHIFAVSNFYFLSSFCFCRLGLLVTGHSSPHVRWTHVAYGGGLFLFYLFCSLSCCSFDYILSCATQKALRFQHLTQVIFRMYEKRLKLTMAVVCLSNKKMTARQRKRWWFFFFSVVLGIK